MEAQNLNSASFKKKKQKGKKQKPLLHNTVTEIHLETPQANVK